MPVMHAMLRQHARSPLKYWIPARRPLPRELQPTTHVKNEWNNAHAAACADDLALRVYSSRLLGSNPSLVLHGGGNTSVKMQSENIFGETEDILHVKASGWDLGTIQPAGFAPLRMAHLMRLAQLPELSDTAMVRELRACLTNPASPDPSVEAILHALLPHKFVDHTHADAVIAVCNSTNGEEQIRKVYGNSLVIVPYVMPGFLLAKACALEFQKHAGAHTIGMLLMHHGIFSFAATAEESYNRMITLVSLAEDHLKRNHAWVIPATETIELSAVSPSRTDLATLRSEVSAAAGFPLLMSTHTNPVSLNFARRPDIAHLAGQGCATPDHVIRTKRLPMLGRTVEQYAADYKSYFAAHAPTAGASLTMLDPAPRIVLDQQFGMCALGRTAADCNIASEIYDHTIEIILRAHALGGWQALPAADLFAIEYWELEQAKLLRAGLPKVFAGEVALITGSASGIGLACTNAMLAQGAAVAGLDRAFQTTENNYKGSLLQLTCDVTDAAAIDASLTETVRAFGGVDMLILNAGVFPASRRIAETPDSEWDATMRINLDANLRLLREVYPMLRLSPRGGRVVIVGSRNVPAPGPGAAAYSASKAALTQLARVAALEWGSDSIRVNTVHPDSVFDTGIWTDAVLTARAAAYNLSVEDYKRRNVLRTEVHSTDVAAVVTALCSPAFAKTTGAQIPIDGGNERVI